MSFSSMSAAAIFAEADPCPESEIRRHDRHLVTVSRGKSEARGHGTSRSAREPMHSTSMWHSSNAPVMPASLCQPRLPLALASLLVLTLLTACSDGPTGPEIEPELTFQVELLGSMDVEAGGQIPLRVVVHADGLPAPDTGVEWDVVEGDGSLEAEAARTDGTGQAEALWQVGTVAGPAALRVRVDGAGEEIVEATVHPGPAHVVASVPDTIYLQARRARGRPGVVFHDQYGNDTKAPADIAWQIQDPSIAGFVGEDLLAAGAEGTTVVQMNSSVGDASIPVRVTYEGVITVTFDDGFRSVHERAFPILEGLGLEANVAIVTQAVEESWPDFLDLDQLTELHDAGWAVASHSVSHARLDTIPMDDLHRELAESRAWIEERGFRGSGVFIVPFHEWSESVREAVAEHYTLARGRSLWKGSPETKAEWIPHDRMDLAALDVDSDGLESEEDLAWLRQALERAVNQGLYFEIFFHRVEEEQVEVFTRIVEVVAEFREHVRTFDELLAQATGSPP